MSEIKTLCENKWVSLKEISVPEMEINGYTFSHETRCNGKIVAILPFRINEKNEEEYLIRYEITPCWGLKPEISSITGGVEEDDPVHTAIEEMYQEAGYEIFPNELIKLGTSHASKSSDTVYYLFAVDLTKKEKVGEAKGDGSKLEKMAECRWAPPLVIFMSKDPQLYILSRRLEKELDQREGNY
jgi:8-oxo-dGTP pyrophosphatase MutT (NUDIX family)